MPAGHGLWLVGCDGTYVHISCLAAPEKNKELSYALTLVPQFWISKKRKHQDGTTQKKAELVKFTPLHLTSITTSFDWPPNFSTPKQKAMKAGQNAMKAMKKTMKAMVAQMKAGAKEPKKPMKTMKAV